MITIINLKQIAKSLLLIIVFSIPFQIKDRIFESSSITGGFNPYLVFELNFQDILFAILLIIFGLLIAKKEIKIENIFFKSKVFLSLLFIFFIESFFWEFSLFNLLVLLRIFEIFLIYIFLTSNLCKASEIRTVFLFSIFTQASIAIAQYINQGAIGLHFLGESILNINLRNIAKIDFDSIKILRSYGTFAHPNILATAISIGIFFTIKIDPIYKKTKTFLFIFLTIGLITTMSRSIIVLTILSLIIYIILSKNIKKDFINKKIISFSILFIMIISSIFGIKNFDIIKTRFSFNDTNTLSERLNQANLSMQMLKTYPFGVGIGNYIQKLSEISQYSLEPWQFQPVHNTFLLIANEMGSPIAIILITSSIWLLYYLYKNKAFWELSLFLFILLSANFDHLFYDIYAGQLLLCLALSECFKWKYQKMIADYKNISDEKIQITRDSGAFVHETLTDENFSEYNKHL